MKFRNFALIAATVILAFGCTHMNQFNAMSLEERAEYMGIAPDMTVDQRKAYLARGDRDARMEYLKEIDLHDKFMGEVAFKRLDDEKRKNFLKAYLNATPSELKAFMATYDEDMQDRIVQKDLQHGWSPREIVLSLGRPEDILEKKANKGNNQLWIYKNQEVATYLYFENNQLKNWAK